VSKRYLYEVRYSEGKLPFKYSSDISISTNFLIEKPEDLIGYVRSQERIHFAIDITIWNVVMHEVSAAVMEWTRKGNGYELYEEQEKI